MSQNKYFIFGIIFIVIFFLALGGYLTRHASVGNETNTFTIIKNELALLFGLADSRDNAEIISLAEENMRNDISQEKASTSPLAEEDFITLVATSSKVKANSKTKPAKISTEQKITAPSETVKPSIPLRILISEIMAGTASSSTNEFIELYNPTDQTINLTGFYIKRKATANGVANNLVSKTSGNFIGKIMVPHGFLLVASKSYSGQIIPDVFYSQNSTFLADNGDVTILYDKNDNAIDGVTYASLTRGKSWERKANMNNSCVLPQGGNEFLGNGCDTGGAGDFVLRDVPNPQNSASLPEPKVSI